VRTGKIVWCVEEGVTEYSRCGLPYAFSGVVESLQAVVGYDQSLYENTNRIDLHLGSKVTGIDPKSRKVEIRNLASRQNMTLGYDSLILTTGASPGTISVPGANLKGVFTIQTINDIEQLGKYLETERAKAVAIIGASLTGSEMAEALINKGIHPIQSEIAPEILPVILDPDMALIVRERAEKHGVEYHLNSS